jgi:excisionase family DNA binding protein
MKKLIEKDFFRIDEVAEYFLVSDRTIMRWIEHGHLSSMKLNNVTRIPYQSVLKCKIGATVKNASATSQ